VPNFSSEKHSEALTAVLLLLKQEKPTADILKHLMAREVSANDKFVSSAITYWMNEYEDKLGELISNHLFKQVRSIQ
jgi:integrator complex subunit 3